jgi:hypothetical protein
MKDAVDLLNERITGLKEDLVEKDAEIARLQETLQKIADGIGLDIPTLIKRLDRASSVKRRLSRWGQRTSG